jgi:ABC-type branched-subunit amino acid transport system substrate-binding protein
MLQGRADGWMTQDRLAVAAVALAVVIAGVSAALLVTDDEASELANPGPSAPEVSATPNTTTAPSKTGATTLSAAPVAVPGNTTDNGSDGGTSVNSAKPCVKRSVDEVGVSDKEITIGQIVTDSNAIPQQFRPAHEGLDAYVRLFNKNGGLCGRKLKLEYRNDQFNAAIHTQDSRDLANRVIAFVGNESLFDQLDYDNSAPYEPNFQGGGSYVPDVGGLAFSYPRGHSPWHAGVIGSVSPTLVGGAQFKFLVDDAKAKKKPCTKGAVFYLQEPTGASEDQARVGQVSLERSWGGNLGSGNTKLYGVSLLNTDVNAYEAIIDQMAGDGMNCLFAYADLGSNIKLAQAARNRGYWPPSKCTKGADCFRVFYVTLAAYEAKFIRDAGDGALDVSTYIPHLPIVESSKAPMRTYLNALKAIPDAQPSTFSVLGYASGAMFIQGLQGCREAPTRVCLMSALRKMKNFTAGGLLGGTTPFRTTRVTYDRYGTFDWKWIFNSTVAMRVSERNGKRDFYRINPSSGFLVDKIHIARGKAA